MNADARVNGDDFFDAWHEAGDQAFAILQDGFETPPSKEVFEHGLELARKRAKGVPIDVCHHARLLVETFGCPPAEPDETS